MKARLSHTTARMNLTDAQIKAQDLRAEETFQSRSRIFIRRYLLATCLALNDLYGFGDKRLSFSLNAIADIIEAYADDSFTPSEVRSNKPLDPLQDPMSLAMEAELESRKQLHIKIGDFLK